MSLLLKKETLYPSVTKPGIYYYSVDFVNYTDESEDYNNVQELNWNKLTGIDYDEPNRFKFTIGTWTELTRNNRGIKIFSNDMMDFVSLGLRDEPAEPKPTSPPDGYLENTEENASIYEPKPPAESFKMYSGVRMPDGDFGGFGDDFDPMFTNRQPPNEVGQEYDYDSSEYIIEGNWSIGDGNIFIPQSSVIAGSNDNGRGGWVKGGINWYVQKYKYVTLGGMQRSHEVKVGDIPFHNEPYLTSAHPEFKLYNVTEENLAFASLTDAQRDKVGGGYWRVDDIKRIKASGATAKISKFFRGLKNTVINLTAQGSWKTYDDIYFEYTWVPNLDNIKFLNREGAYHIPSFEWKWTGTEWIPAETLLTSPQNKRPDNEFVGVPIISDDRPVMTNAISLPDELYTPLSLPLLHYSDFPEFNNTTAPLKIWFAVDFFQQDLDPLFNPNVYKYHIFQWGDEDTLLDVEDIALSEFFALYDTDEEGFSRTQAKRLTQVVKGAKKFKTEQDKLNFTEHTYLESGMYTIRTIVFRLSADESILHETTLISTNINVGETDESLDDFNLYGSDDFNILPIKVEGKELIVGAVDKQSDYVESLKTIEQDDTYGAQDYLEKTYIEKFIPKADDSEYGDYPGKIDLATTRLFTKPYDISYFLNSRATDILIDDTDCLVELNPNEIDNDRIENTGKSDDVCFVVGDYKLIKRKDEPMVKEDLMSTPQIQKTRDNQAI